MKKKLVIAIVVICLGCVGAWLFLHETGLVNRPEKESGAKNNTTIDEKAGWTKTDELNQKISEKVISGNNTESVKDANATEPAPAVLDERIGKEDPSMVEHFDAKDMPPLDMMSIKEQEEINRQMKVKPEDVGKGINEAEMHPDAAAIDKTLDMKEMNPDIKTIEKLLEKTK